SCRPCWWWRCCRRLRNRWRANAQYRLVQLLQLGDHPLDDAEAAMPERTIAGIEPERPEQFGMMLGAPGREHLQIARGKAVCGPLVDRIERVYQAIAKRVGIDVERRMHEVRDISPERLISGPELDRGTEALALHLQPERA